MLHVTTLDEAKSLVAKRFVAPAAPVAPVRTQEVPLASALGRACAADIVAEEGVPPFDRSTVDGYAVRAADTFGSSDALPALLVLAGEVEMGALPDCACEPGKCVRIPTGGQVPAGADAVAMVEHCEDFGDGTIGIARAVAPGENVVFRNDDVKPGQVLIPAGTRLEPHHIGTLASLGATTCSVRAPLRVGIISTGDEIVPVAAVPVASQMRDVNAPMLAAAVEAAGGEPAVFGIVPDVLGELRDAVARALAACDIVLVTGGSSAGEKDNAARVLSELGELLFHGIAVKPGKPTMCADAGGKPVFGLPGHPVAAYFMFLELVRPLLAGAVMGDGAGAGAPTALAELSEGIPSNHGRTELVAVRLRQGAAVPIRGKSGLISQLSAADGYIAIDRDCEGLSPGAPVSVRLF